MHMESIIICKSDDDMQGLEATELRLGLPGTSSSHKNKRPLEKEPAIAERCMERQEDSSTSRPTKSQVVGWPPVQAFRRNVRCHRDLQASKLSPVAEEPATVTPATPTPNSSAVLVKVSMDGAPYLRKIDLGSFEGYKDLRLALDALFRSCFSSSSAAAHQQLTYEDKDGDWMLVGDVPWEMFAASCKRLRIAKAFCGEQSLTG